MQKREITNFSVVESDDACKELATYELHFRKNVQIIRSIAVRTVIARFGSNRDCSLVTCPP